MRIVCILLYWLTKGISMWNDKNAFFCYFFSHLSFCVAAEVEKRNREFLFEKERAGWFFSLTICNFKFSYFRLTSVKGHCLSMIWLTIIKRKTVAWKLDELNYHNIYSQTAGSREEHFYICRFTALDHHWHHFLIITHSVAQASNNYLQK